MFSTKTHTPSIWYIVFFNLIIYQFIVDYFCDIYFILNNKELNVTNSINTKARPVLTDISRNWSEEGSDVSIHEQWAEGAEDDGRFMEAQRESVFFASSSINYCNFCSHH